MPNENEVWEAWLSWWTVSDSYEDETELSYKLELEQESGNGWTRTRELLEADADSYHAFTAGWEARERSG